MATSKKKFDYQAVIMVAGVAVVARPFGDLLQTKVFKEKPQMVPIAMTVASLGLLYFGGDKLKPAGYALLATSVGDLSADMTEGLFSKQKKMEGFSRVNHILDGVETSDYVPQGDLFDLQEIMEEEGDGM